jgi:hypothetical protein
VPNAAERELAAFLASLPKYRRKEFEFGFSSLETQAEQVAVIEDSIRDKGKTREEYECIIKRIPAKWRAYRDREAREASRAALLGKLGNPKGRPLKDELRSQAAELKKDGLSYSQIAMRLKVMRDGKPNGERIRGLLRSAKLKSRMTLSPPEKTQS